MQNQAIHVIYDVNFEIRYNSMIEIRSCINYKKLECLNVLDTTTVFISMDFVVVDS